MLLILPISGDGDVTIKIKNLGVTLTMPYDIVKNEQGKDVIELKSYKYTYENNENTHFKLTNLFNGNKQLKFGNPMLDKPVQKIYNAIKTYLRSQPLEEIAVV
ncbi:hypothetical protein HF086_004851 [Spodoptera exigua]|uniref:Uncharacterized protein n=1 Tax=Spodoptera exigua TaxID=7107 RepID=A0A922M4S7_SPOEX|nr:hypothetical protein HF086_004851 [Spodoptera exigua]